MGIWNRIGKEESNIQWCAWKWLLFQEKIAISAKSNQDVWKKLPEMRKGPRKFEVQVPEAANREPITPIKADTKSG